MVDTARYTKDPNEVKDYTINWATWLGVDTISTSTWAADTGITVDSETESTTTATVWISGGTANNVYSLTNTITTATGRTEEQTIVITVRDSVGAATTRAGMANLITRWRRMVDDTPGSVWADSEAQEILDSYRIDLWQRPTTARPQEINSDVKWLVYDVGLGNIETIDSGTTIFRLYNSAGSAAGTANYSVNYHTGLITFTSDQNGTAWWVDARHYDLHGAAASGWREAAGTKADHYTFSADGARYERSQWFGHCMKMADYYDSLSSTGAGAMQTGTLVRTDVNA
jgi:hypothetical protein